MAPLKSVPPKMNNMWKNEEEEEDDDDFDENVSLGSRVRFVIPLSFIYGSV